MAVAVEVGGGGGGDGGWRGDKVRRWGRRRREERGCGDHLFMCIFEDE